MLRQVAQPATDVEVVPQLGRRQAAQAELQEDVDLARLAGLARAD